MGSFLGQLTREWREHRLAFIWPPMIVFVVLLLACLVALIANSSAEVSLTVSQQSELSTVAPAPLPEAVDPNDMGAMEMLTELMLDVAGSTTTELERKLQGLQNLIAQPFHLIFLIVAVFASLSGLYDERKDHSILFWKSLPVSDLQTVAGKAVFVLWVAPWVTIFVILMAQLLVLGLASVYVEEGMASRLWGAAHIWRNPLVLLSSYLFLGFWVLPFAGWLMLVSAVVPRLPALFAFGIPWLVILLERIFFGTEVIIQAIMSHLAGLPVFSDRTEVTAPFAALMQMQFWVGLVFGLVLLALTIQMRRYRNEI